MTPETSITFHDLFVDCVADVKTRIKMLEARRKSGIIISAISFLDPNGPNKHFKKFTAHFVCNACSCGGRCVAGKNEQSEKTTRTRPETRTLETPT